MASTITLQSVVDWARTFTKLIPIVGVGGFSNEPALSICNNVIQEILAPPFNWKWNRVELATFLTVDDTQDYSQTVADVGWVESCEREDNASTSTPKPIYEVEVVQDLPREFLQGKPEKICKLKETSTTATFRVWPMSDTTIWKLYVTYQAKPPIKTTLGTTTWTPIPDELGYVIRQGFLAMALAHADDQRASQEYTKFQRMIQKALGNADAEIGHEGFFPDAPLMRG